MCLYPATTKKGERVFPYMKLCHLYNRKTVYLQFFYSFPVQFFNSDKIAFTYDFIHFYSSLLAVFPLIFAHYGKHNAQPINGKAFIFFYNQKKSFLLLSLSLL